MATWGTDIPEDLELNEEALANALKKVRCHRLHSHFLLQKRFFVLQIYLTHLLVSLLCRRILVGGKKKMRGNVNTMSNTTTM